MAATDGEFRDSLSGKSQPEEERRRIDSDVSKTSRSSKHYSRSRSRSLDRKRKSGDRKHRRSHGRSKEARKKDSDKALKSSSDEHPEPSDRGCDRLSEDLEERHRRKEKKSSRTRSMSRSHSRERRHQGRHPNKKRSRSRSGEKRSRSHERKRRARSRSRSKHRHRSRSREKKKTEKARKKSRSRSGSPIVFRGRNTAMDAQEALARRLERAKKLQEQKEKELLEKRQEQAAATPLISDPATPSPAQKVAALLASGTQVTPQIAVAAQMAALHAKTLAETGIAVPSYYNPSAVNPMKFAEQEKKRKMLWQGKKEGDKSQTAELWEKLNFGNKDQNVKFRKLMGIKGEEESACSEVTSEALKTLQQQEEMFRNLDVQYEMARSQTHTQRGTGLGFFSSSSRGMDAV